MEGRQHGRQESWASMQGRALLRAHRRSRGPAAVVGKTELRAPLGADKLEARRKLSGALAEFEKQIDQARQIAGGGKPFSAPLSNVEIAKLVFAEALMRDDLERDFRLPPTEEAVTHEDRIHNAFAPSNLTRSERKAFFDPARKKALKRTASGDAKDDEAAALVGHLIDAMIIRGATQICTGTPEWRSMARMLAGVELDALDRSRERDRGDYTGKPSLPILNKVANDDAPAPVGLSKLLEEYGAGLARSGRGAAAMKRWRPCFASLKDFLGHDDAARLTRQDVINWRTALETTHQAKTIRDCHMAGLKAVLA